MTTLEEIKRDLRLISAATVNARKQSKRGVVVQGHFVQFTDGTFIDLDPTMKLTPAFDLQEGDIVEVSVKVRKEGKV